MDRNAFQAACAEFGLHLNDAQLDAFAQFEEDLYVANESKNFTRIPREDCWIRHFVDSLALCPLIPEGASVLDIGTGPGLPAWPLAQARPDIQVTALDSNAKMLAFLEAHPLPNLTIKLARAEDSALRERFDIVTGRAVAPLIAQAEISAQPVKVRGYFLPMRTGADEFLNQMGELSLLLESVHRFELPNGQGSRAIPLYRKVDSTHPIYPRPWGVIKNKPLYKAPVKK